MDSAHSVTLVSPVISVYCRATKSWGLLFARPKGPLTVGQTGSPHHSVPVGGHRTGSKCVALVADTLFRCGKKWFRYDAPDKRMFKQISARCAAQPRSAIQFFKK